jgi:hypothetical protein
LIEWPQGENEPTHDGAPCARPRSDINPFQGSCRSHDRNRLGDVGLLERSQEIDFNMTSSDRRLHSALQLVRNTALFIGFLGRIRGIRRIDLECDRNTLDGALGIGSGAFSTLECQWPAASNPATSTTSECADLLPDLRRASTRAKCGTLSQDSNNSPM